MIRFSRYQGSKTHFIEDFNKMVEKSDNETYIEPFIGSGAIFFNLKKEYKKYIINDFNPKVANIYRTFKEIDYDFYIERIKYIEDNFGDIKDSKEAFYKFRTFYNDNFFDKSTRETIDTNESNVYLHILFNTCINSMPRFGPNGFNSSYGNCYFKIPRESFEKISKILKKTEIYNKDYKEVIKDVKDADIFLDPPYFERPGSYSNNFTENATIDFIETIKSKSASSRIFYTDIYNPDIDKLLGWNKMITKELRNSSPNSKGEVTSDEVCYYNFDYIEESSFDDFI